MRQSLLWTGLGLALILLLWWTLESYQYVTHLPSSARDRAASALLLEEYGIRSERVHGQAQLFPLPDTDTVLVMRLPRGRLENENLNRLKHWVADGGTLVLEVRLEAYEPNEDDNKDTAVDQESSDSQVVYTAEDYMDMDGLSYAFGITGWHYIEDANLVRGPLSDGLPGHFYGDWLEGFIDQCLASTTDISDHCLNVLCGDPDEWLAYASGELDGRHYQLDLDPHGELSHFDQYDWEGYDPADYPATPETDTRLSGELGNQTGAQLLSLSLGVGRVIALTDTDIWDNQRLHHLDHARLLVDLSQGKQALVWVEQIDMPGLLEWLWPRSWPLASALAALLLAWLASRLPRRGPLLDRALHTDADFLEHLRASSRFLWRQRQRTELLRPLREQVRRQLRSHGAKDNDRSRSRVAARITGLDGNRIHQALTIQPEDTATLLDVVTTLQALRSKL